MIRSFHKYDTLPDMGRKVDVERPGELLEAVVRWLLQHGFENLSLRPLAKGVGSSPRVLLYFFGSKEQLITRVLAELRTRQRAAFGHIDVPMFATAVWTTWKTMSTPESLFLFRLYFEAYGMALQKPILYREFLHSAVEDWLEFVARPLQQDGHTRKEARVFATVVLAGLRGFMLDLCATGDRRRVDGAIELWAASLDTMLPSGEGEHEKK